MPALLADLALVVAALAVAAGAIAFIATHDLGAAVGMLLDLLLAAGLIGLAAADSWTAIATAAGVVVVRLLVIVGFVGSRRRQVDWQGVVRGNGSS